MIEGSPGSHCAVESLDGLDLALLLLLVIFILVELPVPGNRLAL